MDHKKKTLLISQELFFAKTLAGNDKTKRDRALKKLHRWLYARTHDGTIGFTKEDFMRIWKGLFYCMWMSDKPLVQEEVAENISQLIHSVGEGDSIFIKCFFIIMAHEWNGIDQHRLDKFQMLVRRFLRQTLEWARIANWSVSAPTLNSVFEETILKPTGALEGLPIGLILHFSDIFLEELSKIVDENGQPPDSQVVIHLLRPFARLLARNNDPRIVKSVTETVFHHLMRQSDVGLDYEELRKKGWLQRREDVMEDDEGIGGEGDDDENEGEEASEQSEGEEEEGMVLGAKDPRAGGVDVLLPQLDVDLEDLASMLEDEIKEPSIRPKLRRRLEDIARKFRSITRGRYPLQIGTVPPDLKWKKSQRLRAVRKAAIDLMKEEEDFLKAEVEGVESLPKKKPAKLNGKLPEGQEGRKGRKRKRGKRKSRAERRKAAMNKVEENGIESVKRKYFIDDEAEKEPEDPPPKRRRSIIMGWQVDELNPPPKQMMNNSIGGRWSVENRVGNGNITGAAKKVKSPKPRGTLEDTDSCETEIVIKNLRPNPFSPLGRKVKTPKAIKKEEMGSATKNKTPSSDKRVKIVLSRNLAQETHEYHKSLRASPAIPFDPSKVPAQGVLKATSSPIMLNPFYRTSPRRQKKLLL